MPQRSFRPVPVRSPLPPPELADGLYTLSQPHENVPVGWVWVQGNGGVEEWVVTTGWRSPASGNTPQDVTFAYVAASSTVSSVTAFLAWIKSNYPSECPGITTRYRHVVTPYSVSCPP